MTIDSMLDAARRHVRPAELSLVVVADADQVATQLDDLSWIPIERVDEGN